jgi:hypothetical protein
VTVLVDGFPWFGNRVSGPPTTPITMDVGGRIEWASQMLGRSALRDDTTANLFADPVARHETLVTQLAANIVLPSEALLIARGGATARVDLLATPVTDTPATQETIGNLSTDRIAAGEDITITRRVDASLCGESLSVQQAAPRPPGESAATAPAHAVSAAEVLAGATARVTAFQESLLGSVIRLSVFADIAAVSSSDTVAQSESTGVISLTARNASLVEILTAHRRDAPSPAECLASVAADIPARDGFQVRISADIATLYDAFATARADGAARVESTAGIRIDFTQPADQITAINRRLVGLTEFTATIRAENVLPADTEASLIRAAAAHLDAIAGMTRQVSAAAEITALSVAFIGDNALPIEWLATVRKQAGDPLEYSIILSTPPARILSADQVNGLIAAGAIDHIIAADPQGRTLTIRLQPRTLNPDPETRKL